jgi:tetratricopeptide (TPR) repeat protein
MGDLTGDGERLRQVEQLYESAVFGGDRAAPARAERVLDGLEADLALARGKALHAHYLTERKEVDEGREGELFERAVALYRGVEDVRGEGEALFWLGTWHQVVREAYDEAVPCFRQAYDLADAVGDRLTLSYATRHLAFAAEAAGRMDEARGRYAESVRLREELGFLPGVAAAKLSLGQFTWQVDGDREAALRLMEEARMTAEECGAHGVLAWIAGARESMG